MWWGRKGYRGLQWNATEGLEPSSDCRQWPGWHRPRQLAPLGPVPGPEILEARAVPYVELIADHGKKHRMRAVEQVAVRNRVQADVGRNLGRPAAVPAGAMGGFRQVAHRRGQG